MHQNRIVPCATYPVKYEHLISECRDIPPDPTRLFYFTVSGESPDTRYTNTQQEVPMLRPPLPPELLLQKLPPSHYHSVPDIVPLSSGFTASRRVEEKRIMLTAVSLGGIMLPPDRISDMTGIMSIKERPNHKIYIQSLRNMSPEERLIKSFELSAFSKELFLHGLRKRFPTLSERSIMEIYLKRLEKCHNRIY